MAFGVLTINRTVPARGGAFGGGLKFKFATITTLADSTVLTAANFKFPKKLVAILPAGAVAAGVTKNAFFPAPDASGNITVRMEATADTYVLAIGY